MRKTCSIAACDRPARGRGWCQGHYMRWYKTGEAGDTPLERRDPNRGCLVDGCEGKHDSSGYCAPHYKRWIKTGDAGPAAIRPQITPADRATYYTVHLRLRRRRGPAKNRSCVRCGGTALHWAYDHTDPNERIDDEVGAAFSVDPDRYHPMCMSCHKEFDMARIHGTPIELILRGTE